MAKRTSVWLSVLFLFALAACGGVEPTPLPATEAPPDVPTVTKAPAGVSAVTEATVSIANMAFQPHTLVVATGATVTWQNDDAVAHTVTSGEGWFDSGQLAAGESFSHQFDQPGTFRYGCTNHPTDGGLVIVLPGGAVAPGPVRGQGGGGCLSRQLQRLPRPQPRGRHRPGPYPRTADEQRRLLL